MARRILRVPNAVIALSDETGQSATVMAVERGLWAPNPLTPALNTLCQQTVQSGELVVVDDTALSSLLADTVDTSDLDLGAFAGAPLIDRSRRTRGALCAFDVVPRAWTEDEIDALTDLAVIAMDALEIRAAVSEAEVSGVEGHYRDLFDNANDIIYAHDLLGRFTSMNRACERVSGYTRDALLRMNIADVIAPEYAEQAWRMIERKLAGEPATTYSLEIVTRTGKRAMLEVSTRLVFQDGRPVGVQGIARDVSERLRAERLERDRNRVLEMVGQNQPLGEILTAVASAVEQQLPDSVCCLSLLHDNRLRIAAAPSLPERLAMGLTGALSSPDGVTCGRAAYRGELATTRDIASDPAWASLRDAAAEHGLRSCWSVPILSGFGQVLGTCDVYGPEAREPARHDLKLLDTASRLAATAVEHASLFEQAALADGLRELARLKTEFLSTASHELRTPLSLIHGYAELLLHRAPKLTSTEVQEMASEIYSGSQTMVRLVDDLLDLSRLEHGRLQLRRCRTQVADVLTQTVARFRLLPGGERIELHLSAMPEAEMDGARVAQMVANLLVNALRYAPTGPIVVRAARRQQEIRIEVADHGPGIPIAEQQRIWEKFYRGEQSTVSEHRGSGLGLAIVKQLAEQHGGRSGLRSVPGQGSTFWLTIPIEEPR